MAMVEEGEEVREEHTFPVASNKQIMAIFGINR